MNTLTTSVNNGHSHSPGARTWGQFIDQPGDHSGIYGTTAALMILCQSSAFVQQCQRTATVLPLLPTSEVTESDGSASADKLLNVPANDGANSSNQFNFKPQNLRVTLKCVSVIDAICMVNSQLGSDAASVANATQLDGIIQYLERQIINSEGWDYDLDAGDSEEGASVQLIPTARIVSALMLTSIAEAEVLCKRSILWIARQIQENRGLTTLEYAFGLNALTARGSIDWSAADEATINRAVKSALDCLERFTRKRPPILVEYYEHLHYESIDIFSGRTISRYMFYPVDVVVASALIEAGQAPRFEKYVRKVVIAIADRVRAEEAYVSAATRRKATSDAYWCFRLLRLYRHDVATSGLARRAIPSFFALSRGTQAAVFIVGVIVVCVLGGLAAADYIFTYVRWLAGGIAAVLGGTLGGIIFEWIRNPSSNLN